MSVLIIGDLHIKTCNERQIAIATNDIMEIIINTQIAFIVILGDTLDNMGKIDMECLCRAADLFELLASTGKHLFVLIGNHDRKNNREYLNNRHPFRGFCRYPGITIVSSCFVYDFALRDIGVDTDQKMKFCFVPYVPGGMYMKALNDCGINPAEISMFFSHSEFDGCDISKTAKTKWEVWPPDFPLNISGHIHNYQIVQDNLIYTGTPFQHDFTEPNNKGVFLLDLKSSDFKLTKMSLKIPPKVEIKVNYTELQNLIIDPNVELRLRIYGPTAYVKDIMNRPDMASKFINVSKRFEEEAKDKHIVGSGQTLPLSLDGTTANLQFYNSLIEKVSTDPRMYAVYSALFINQK